jgi:hypothetical protein
MSQRLSYRRLLRLLLRGTVWRNQDCSFRGEREADPIESQDAYAILTPNRAIQNRNLMPRDGINPAGKESVMLDLAFVALGFAVIGLMGFYAFALRQL